MAKCDSGERNEKCNYASDMLSEWLISRFIVIYGERWFFKCNLAKILPLKSKLSRKIQRFNVADKTMEMLKTS